MTATKTLLTAKEFDNYDFEEDKRYELDEGELIEMSRPAYRHNRVLTHFTGEAYVYFKNNPIGELLNSENLYAIAPLVRLAPDAAIILGDRRNELEGSKVIYVIPDIAVEVLSPNERPGRIHRKLRQYFAAGVKQVWLLDPESNTIEIWTGPTLPERELAVGYTLTSPLLPGFELPLVELFS